jgi:hypothetical protein
VIALSANAPPYCAPARSADEKVIAVPVSTYVPLSVSSCEVPEVPAVPATPARYVGLLPLVAVPAARSTEPL